MQVVKDFLAHLSKKRVVHKLIDFAVQIRLGHLEGRSDLVSGSIREEIGMEIFLILELGALAWTGIFSWHVGYKSKRETCGFKKQDPHFEQKAVRT